MNGSPGKNSPLPTAEERMGSIGADLDETADRLITYCRWYLGLGLAALGVALFDALGRGTIRWGAVALGTGLWLVIWAAAQSVREARSRLGSVVLVALPVVGLVWTSFVILSFPNPWDPHTVCSLLACLAFGASGVQCAVLTWRWHRLSESVD